ncbi:ACT domain-containing protein [Aquihabitans sp. G128]|uniref:ACT domain-containing protein n=1 Tax=Aquihabitans sp. G128 TaxID=2849779 RepID=UPI001C23CDE4|nr:ACT domain-containing protein [Aquihabitans sp. G128]QXC60742.1 ACT domain-containing protein [Aquihabitans sp. G128]
MPGETDLSTLLAALRPVRRAGEVVFVSHGPGRVPPAEGALATVVEDEGTTWVVPRSVADEHGWAYDLVLAWITLEVRSSLAAVGLTAAVSAALTAEGISANVLAGFHHDHLLVPLERADDALAALQRLSTSG